MALKKNRLGLTVNEQHEYNDLKERLGHMGLNIAAPLLYIRQESFNGEACIVCGGTRLIYGVGRYVIITCNEEHEDENPIPICGYCSHHLEEQGVELEFE
jgi:hypothetical protein